MGVCLESALPTVCVCAHAHIVRVLPEFFYVSFLAIPLTGTRVFIAQVLKLLTKLTPMFAF